MKETTIPKDFFWRRMHSLAGLWLVLFIIEHLLTNSQAALFFGDDGKGFIESVNWIHNLPYLPAIELLLLGVPFLIHGLWGIKYALEARLNSFSSNGSKPALYRYKRNRAFTWQRVTSWILAVGVVAHVVQMRFIDYPIDAEVGREQNYMVRITDDPGLATLSQRLDFRVFTASKIDALSDQTAKQKEVKGLLQEQQENYLEALLARPLKKDQVIAVAGNFGTASLLAVRDTFKMPLMIILYTLFVIAAGYHAFNGLWTSFITWGINITEKTQRKFLVFTWGLMIVVTLLGLASVWITYLNLRN